MKKTYLVVGDEIRVHTPGCDKVLTIIIFIDSGGVRARQLDPCTGGAKQHLRGCHTPCMGQAH